MWRDKNVRKTSKGCHSGQTLSPFTAAGSAAQKGQQPGTIPDGALRNALNPFHARG
eukprot:m.36523 g.36523  ORF g.36523 m.36523 type:complete len:56 (-) comp7582_c0_seq2:287-454(-)